MQEVAVLGSGMFVPGYAHVKALMQREHDPSRLEATASFIPPRHRRRASPFTKALAEAYDQALTSGTQATAGSAGSEVGGAHDLRPENLASVFGSALGEAATMIGLLEQMWSEEGSLSPMRFVTSVHNAAAGVVSITTKNQGFTTSIGADHDTPAMCLAEGIAWVLSHEACVLVCCGDESVPQHLLQEGAGWTLMTGALLLGPVRSGDKDAASHPLLNDKAARISLAGVQAATLPPPDIDADLARNPCAGMLDLLVCLATGQEGILRLDRGQGAGYAVKIAS